MAGLKDHVLIVDDDQALATLYRVELQETGYRVSVARSSQEAIAQVQKDRPDVVVMDIRMPGMDGLELMGRILSIDRRIRVVLNTAYASYQDSFSSWAADAYVLKSSNLRLLLETIDRLLAEPEGRPTAQGAPARPASRSPRPLAKAV